LAVPHSFCSIVHIQNPSCDEPGSVYKTGRVFVNPICFWGITELEKRRDKRLFFSLKFDKIKAPV